MAKQYYFDFEDGGRILFGITPENPVVGQPATIKGRAFSVTNTIKGISVIFDTSYTISGEHRLNIEAWTFVEIPPNSYDTDFEITFTPTYDNIAWLTGNRASKNIYFSVWAFYDCYVSNGHMYGTGTYTLPDSTMYCTFLEYALEPKVIEFDFERASIFDSQYEYSEDGAHAMCKSLKITKNDNVSVDEITTAKIVRVGTDDSIEEYIISNSVLLDALTENGYSETAPSLIEDEFKLGVTYTLTLVIGDDYEQTTYDDMVMKSFAIIHLSGAANGGVSICGFSSSTDDEPKFECYPKAYLYGGVDEFTVKMIGNILYPIGSILIYSPDAYTENPQEINPPTRIFGGAWIRMSGFLAGEGTVIHGSYPNVTSEYYQYGTTGTFSSDGEGRTYTVVGIWKRIELFDPEKEV